MLKNLLVLGDSYSKLDANHSHWATMWANINNINIDHMGHSGGSHVYIVNKFLQTESLLEKYDTIFYTVTDFLSLDLQANEISTQESTDTIRSFYNAPTNTIDIGKILEDMPIKDKVHSSPWILKRLKNANQQIKDWYSMTFGYSEQDIEKVIKSSIKNMETGYNIVLTQWISRANLFALETLILKCKEKNVKLLLVMPWQNMFLDTAMFNDTQIFKCPQFSMENNSENHYTKNDHKQLLRKFIKDLENKEIIL
jgi:RecG-like helicase